MERTHRFSPARRKFLIAGAASALSLGTAGALFWNRSAEGRALWVEQVVRRNLPGVVLDEPSLQVFVRDVLGGDLLSARVRRVSAFAQQKLPWMTARVPKLRRGLEKMERQVLTEYLLGGNFFRVSDPKRETITYYGRAVACANPFVR